MGADGLFACIEINTVNISICRSHIGERPNRIMMEHQEQWAIILLLLVAGTVCGAHMVLSSLGNVPFAVPYTADVAEGSLVVIEGEVEKITLTQEGGHRILRVDGVPVFLPASAADARVFLAGDRVRIYGIVQMYRQEREILVRNSADIILLFPNAPFEPHGEGALV
jgi:hypothetical protein